MGKLVGICRIRAGEGWSVFGLMIGHLIHVDLSVPKTVLFGSAENSKTDLCEWAGHCARLCVRALSAAAILIYQNCHYGFGWRTSALVRIPDLRRRSIIAENAR